MLFNSSREMAALDGLIVFSRIVAHAHREKATFVEV